MKKRKKMENEEIIKDMIEKQCAKKKMEDDKKDDIGKRWPLTTQPKP
jgi:hypothetical protein